MAEQDISEINGPTGHNWGLATIALLAVVFGVWQISNSIKLPFAPKIYNDDSQMTVANETVLRASDTDGDGLSDYEEINFYRTSLYLKDTDSDGLDDKAEVDNGSDPNCPQGQDCLKFVAPVSQSETAGYDVEAAPSPEEIRQMLKNNGATDEMLAKYNDQTLINIYQQVAGENKATTGSAGALDTSLQLTDQEKELLQKMSGAELRQFLIAGGADAKELDIIDDTTLQATVKQLFGF
ncbi:thrombospondin type 3 repeat-containing protein [Patescibacteria group bacterium]|nr:thrombospondin type 3 repeat-containing protein [Patescibacteria group bacterium]